MEDSLDWIFYQDIDFDDIKYNKFNIDTRDFHCSYKFISDVRDDFDVLKKYPDFFHTTQEVKELLNRYYIESGGQKKWRFFNLVGVNNWCMKYIRIRRTELGFIICNSDDIALRKSLLSNNVEVDYGK